MHTYWPTPTQNSITPPPSPAVNLALIAAAVDPHPDSGSWRIGIPAETNEACAERAHLRSMQRWTVACDTPSSPGAWQAHCYNLESSHTFQRSSPLRGRQCHVFLTLLSLDFPCISLFPQVWGWFYSNVEVSVYYKLFRELLFVSQLSRHKFRRELRCLFLFIGSRGVMIRSAHDLIRYWVLRLHHCICRKLKNMKLALKWTNFKLFSQRH